MRQNQIHDFNLDIRPFPSGLFWTNFIPNSSLQAGGGEDGASLDVDGLALFDYFNVTNSLANGNSVTATVSYTTSWAGDGTPLTIGDGVNFHAAGRQTTATFGWSASEVGFRFHSDPPNTTTTNFAFVGRERNGVFF